MSESEQMGRLRREITAAYESTRYKPSDSDMLIADAIDRLAADVAAVKAKVNDIMPEDVAHLVECEKAWVRLVEEKETAAIRERDEARAEVERLRREITAAHKGTGYTPDQSDWLMAGAIDRLAAELAARQAANHPGTLDSSTAAPQPAAPAAGWLTAEERGAVAFAAASFRGHAIAGNLKAMADQLDAILARAGSPPVVEVPEEKIGCRHLLHRIYRDALDKAGVSWKEVPRGQDLK